MQLHQVEVKFFVTAKDGFASSQLVEVFHRWIREHRLGDVLLIDVADYTHVPNGPGVMIVADGAHYRMDEGDGQLGLAYARKRDALGDGTTRLTEALAAALTACSALADDPAVGSQLVFDTSRFQLAIVSKLIAADQKTTLSALEPDLNAVLDRLYPEVPRTIEMHSGRGPFTLSVRAQEAPALSVIAERIGAAVPQKRRLSVLS